MHIHILTAGGTIDKEYFDAKSAYEVGSPVIAEMLGSLKLNFTFDVERVIAKDSLEMTDTDRQALFEAAQHCAHDKILVTHGTDTMALTARKLAGVADKTIVLTGSMQPGKFQKTDALFNIAFALGALQQLPPGCYVCMNGRTYDGRDVRKNREAGTFEGRAVH